MSTRSGTTEKTFDGIVIGGGAAGMFAAIRAASLGNRVLLLERNRDLGKKLLITGKGRCNVTNHCTASEALENVPHNGRFLSSVMRAFPPESAMAFFESHGCPLKTERGNRVFPASDSARSVLACLRAELLAQGVIVRTARARHICCADGHACGVQTDAGDFAAAWVILATGGASYPATGSTGDGYAMAAELGHTVLPPEGSLVPLSVPGADCPDMQGLSLRNVGVTLQSASGRVLYRDFGELLFTHFGVSGPTALSASAHLAGSGCRMLLDLKPALDAQKLDARILRDLALYKNRSMAHALSDLLPRAMIPVVLRRLGVDEAMQANAFPRAKRRALTALLKAFSLENLEKRPVAEAIITRGGVETAEIDPRTMESKLVPGLYFAGELIDCDAYTGGFNLQIAWATAYAAGSRKKAD